MIEILRTGRDLPLDQQVLVLSRILQSSETLWHIITTAQRLGVRDYYVGAGCVAQTVWNHLHGFDLMQGIKDVDIAFFDERLDYEFENEVVERAYALWGRFGLKLDVKNQARVHLWYEQRFGYAIPPYPSLEAALNTWPTTATAVGVRAASDLLTVYAPFGLNDLFSGVVRANKTQITREIYDAKVVRWQKAWPGLRIVGWDD